MTPPMATCTATRESVLRLLSFDEVTRLSMIESAPALTVGAEYLDLDRLGFGVQVAHGLSRLKLGTTLPRSGVTAETWLRILAHLC